MTGFEPGSSGIASDRSANCATTTSQCKVLVNFFHLISVPCNATTVHHEGPRLHSRLLNLIEVSLIL